MPRPGTASPQTVEVLCHLLAESDSWSYGYDVSRSTGLKSGTLYPILMRLTDRGWLEACWAEPERPGRPPRHLYRLTGEGRAAAARLTAARTAPWAARRLRPVVSQATPS
jgi:PadR family transcriptional regulator, regulatory protein PadR